MYQEQASDAAASDGAAPGTGDSSAAPAGGDGVVDAEFEEVKDGKDQ